MKTLTVITTTYNRAYCLHQVYNSLCRQKSKDFLWLIIDDGSNDNTLDLVNQWIDESIVEIEYHYKQNGGMHTARNYAYAHINTELNVIIDSDDWMTDDAVQDILGFWNDNKNPQIYGIIAYNINKSGQLIGTAFPDSIKEATFTELTGKYNVRGDKKLVMRSEFSRLYPFPEFEGEKFYPASYKYRMLDLKYKLLIMPKAICVVDYNSDSMTYNKYEQYKTCSQGFAHYRNEMIRISKDPLYNIKNAIHYIAESLFAGNQHFIRNSSKPVYIGLMYPIGLLYYHYLCKTKDKY